MRGQFLFGRPPQMPPECQLELGEKIVMKMAMLVRNGKMYCRRITTGLELRSVKGVLLAVALLLAEVVVLFGVGLLILYIGLKVFG